MRYPKDVASRYDCAVSIVETWFDFICEIIALITSRWKLNKEDN